MEKSTAEFPAKLDLIASDACTRSGAFALLISAALFSLIPNWIQHDRAVALGQYAGIRLNLSIAISQLDQNPDWHKYLETHRDAESLPLEQLRQIEIKKVASENATGASDIKSAAKMPASTNSSSTSSKPKAPSLLPPTALGFVIRIYEIDDVCNNLSKLNDSELLTNARKASGFFDYSIYRWAMKRASLMNENLARGNPTSVVLPSQPDQNAQASFVPQTQDQNVLRYLTLSNARELASLELPKLTDTSVIGGGRDDEVQVAPGSLPRDLYMASLFADVILIFSIVYFVAFAIEAVGSSTFPADGTLFGAFSKSNLTLAAFLIALMCPVFASMFVAIASGRLPLVFGTVVVAVVMIWAYRTLQSKLYFEPLRTFLSQKFDKHLNQDSTGVDPSSVIPQASQPPEEPSPSKD